MSAENNSSLNLEKCTVVVVDIAGTTTSLNFVKDQLFPFVNEQVEEFLKTNWDDETVKQAVKELKEDEEVDIQKAVELVKQLTIEESENKGLKIIQGLIYKKGYTNGDLKGHVFDEVVDSLETWAKSRKVAVYSTGSVESQKLLFSHTIKGDASNHISKFFDQSIGAKTKVESYQAIAKEFTVECDEMVFVTDNVDEAKAAKEAGVVAVIIKREGNPAISEEYSKIYPIINTFNELNFEISAKRKLEENAAIEVPPSKVPKTDEELVCENKKEIDTVEKSKSLDTAETAMDVDDSNEVKIENDSNKNTDQIECETATNVTKQLSDISKENINEKTDVDRKVNVNDEQETICNENKKSDEGKPKENITLTTTEKEEKVDENLTTQCDKEKKEQNIEKSLEDEKKTNENDEVVEKTTNEETVENSVKTDETVKVIEEKENKSVLANGVENGANENNENNDKMLEKSVVDGDESTTTTTTTTTETKDESEEGSTDAVAAAVTEVKVKKIDEKSESKTVSVEV